MESWAVIEQIKRRVEAGEPVAQIARDLRLDRKTVRKYRELTREQIRDLRRQGQGRPGKLEEHEEWLRKRVKEYEEDGVVNAVSLHRELVERGYEGSPRSVRRMVATMVTKPRKRIYEPFETAMGHQAMVDLAESRNLRIGDGRSTMYFVVMVLSHSRKKYGEWYERPISTEMFLGFHERAFASFEGVVAEVVYDQTKLAVIQERFGECEFNEDFYAFCRYYQFEPFICRKSDPETKGKIESVVRYAKRGFLPGRSFIDYQDVQRQWDQWVETVANAKVHETTKTVPAEVWEEEKKHLRRMPTGRYRAQPSMETRKALANGLIKVLGNRYSVPWTHQRAEVLVRVTEEKVEIYDQKKEHLYSHWRCMGRGQTIKEKTHYERAYAVPTEELERQVQAIYGLQGLFSALKAKFPRHYREQLKRLILLGRDHAVEDLREAANRSLSFGCVGVGNIEKILRGVEANKAIISLRKVEGGATLKAGSSELRGLSYYEDAAQEIQEEQDEQASV
jgi:transposase